MKLYINTLGVFDLKMDEESLFKESNRSYRILKLLQYFLVFRNKKLLPETIIDSLWHNNESFDPKNMLRAQIFRLRQMIKQLIPEGLKAASYLSINFRNGYYNLDMGENTIIDIELFEELIIEGDKVSTTNILGAIELYEEAIHLYKGSFLEENANDIWVVPIRNYYSRLYLKTFFKLIDLLKDLGENEHILELCEKAIGIMPNEEGVHLCLMEAMLKLGQIKNAMSHYEYASTLLAEELDSTPSVGMKDIQRKIQNYFVEKSDIDVGNIRKKLEAEEIGGPLLCESDYFKFLYNILNRKRYTIDEWDYIGLITLENDDHTQEDIHEWSKITTSGLNNTLRRGDVFSFWNDTQVLILLTGVKENGIHGIEERITKGFPKNMKYKINIKFTLINDESDYTIKSPI